MKSSENKRKDLLGSENIILFNNSCQQYTGISVKDVPESERQKQTTTNDINSSSISANHTPILVLSWESPSPHPAPETKHRSWWHRGLRQMENFSLGLVIFFSAFFWKKKKSSLEGSEWQRESSRAGCTSALFVLHPDRHRWLWLQQLPFIPVCAPLIPNANLLL